MSMKCIQITFKSSFTANAQLRQASCSISFYMSACWTPYSTGIAIWPISIFLLRRLGHIPWTVFFSKSTPSEIRTWYLRCVFAINWFRDEPYNNYRHLVHFSLVLNLSDIGCYWHSCHISYTNSIPGNWTDTTSYLNKTRLESQTLILTQMLSPCKRLSQRCAYYCTSSNSFTDAFDRIKIYILL